MTSECLKTAEHSTRCITQSTEEPLPSMPLGCAQVSLVRESPERGRDTLDGARMPSRDLSFAVTWFQDGESHPLPHCFISQQSAIDCWMTFLKLKYSWCPMLYLFQIYSRVDSLFYRLYSILSYHTGYLYAVYYILVSCRFFTLYLFSPSCLAPPVGNH